LPELFNNKYFSNKQQDYDNLRSWISKKIVMAWLSRTILNTLPIILVLLLYVMNLVFLSCSDKWSPALQIRTVLLSIQALLSAPNPDDPLANDVAEQWKVNEAQAIEIGK